MSTGSVVRKYWRRFIFAWLFPVSALCVVLLPAWSSHTGAVFIAVLLPLFFVCYGVALTPVFTKQVPVLVGVFYALVVPFVIWVVLIFTIFGLAILGRGQAA